MNWLALPVLLALVISTGALADVSPASAPPPDGQLCRQAIAAAEKAHGIPSRLLAAIARVESGRKHQASGTFSPWPWTINADGQGSFYDRKAEAVAAALSMRMHATRSVDVGCMQISLTYHPDAFSSLEQAFDPASNAEYGARFLTQLFEKSGSWARAVELYHSATPELGQEYGRRVYAAWPVEQNLAMAEPTGFDATAHNPAAGVSPSPHVPPLNRSFLASAFRPTVPHIIMQTPGLAGSSLAGRTLDSYRSAPVRFAFRAP
jgi:soluble lytic murein transglycosylase-like protein